MLCRSGTPENIAVLCLRQRYVKLTMILQATRQTLAAAEQALAASVARLTVLERPPVKVQKRVADMVLMARILAGSCSARRTSHDKPQRDSATMRRVSASCL